MAAAAHMATTCRIAPRAARFGDASAKKQSSPSSSSLSSSSALRRGGARAMVRASQATPAATAVTPLTEKDLIDYLRSGCKPKSAWR